MREARQQQQRLMVLWALMLGTGLVLVARLYSIQLVNHDFWAEMASAEHRGQIPLVPRRGALLDANGYPLATSVMYESVYVVGSQVKDPARVAELLAPLLELSPAEIAARIDPRKERAVLLKEKLPAATAARLLELDLSGIYLREEPFREYPEGSLAAQVLGFVGKDFTGLSGLELSFDEELAGEVGRIETDTDTLGREVALGRRGVVPPKDGADLVLTIDRYVQRLVERELEAAIAQQKAAGGLVVVMEPQTGAVLAMASRPTYRLTDDVIYKPEEAQLYKPVPVTNQYEPGSVMKVITMAAGLEEGVVSPGTTVNDAGVVVIDGVPLRNWDYRANGVINMTQVLVYSSNVGAQYVSGLLGAERFYRYIDAFGFGRPTGIRLPGEAAGTVRRPGSERWTRLDLATNSYGQGIAVTPIQMVAAIAAIANDGVLMRPQIVRELRRGGTVQPVHPEVVRRVVSAKTARTLTEMMVEVMNQKALEQHRAHNRLEGYQIAGKTGTADFPTDLGYTSGKTFASLVGFAPAENPRFVMLVRLDAPEGIYGGVAAAPVFMRIARDLLAYYRIPPLPELALRVP